MSFKINFPGRKAQSRVPASTRALSSTPKIQQPRHARAAKGIVAREFWPDVPPVSMALERWWRPALNAETMVVLRESDRSGAPPVEYAGLPEISTLLATPNGYQRPESMWMGSTANYFLDGIVAYLAQRGPAPRFSPQQEETGELTPATPESFALVDGAAIVPDCEIATSHVAGSTLYEDRLPTDGELARAGGRPLSYLIETGNYGRPFRVPARDLGAFVFDLGQPIGCWASPLAPFCQIGYLNMSVHERSLAQANSDISTLRQVELDGGVGSREEMEDAVDDLQERYQGPQNSGRAIPGGLVRFIKDVDVRPLEFNDDARASREELLGAMCIPAPFYNGVSSQYANNQTAEIQMGKNARHKMSSYGQALTGILLTPEQRANKIFIGPRSLTNPDPLAAELETTHMPPLPRAAHLRDNNP